MQKQKKASIEFAGRTLLLETGHMAKQSSGAVYVQYGGTCVLVTACVSKEAKEGIDFFPLTVEYQEKTYAAGRIPGGYFKREGRPSENEILISRLIDRPIRPLFPKDLLNEVQVMAMVLSSDGENDPDVLAVLGASCALSISEIPFGGPLGVVRVGRINGNFVLNPTYAQSQESDIDVVVVGTKDEVCMLEIRSKMLSEEVILDAIKFGHKNYLHLIELQEEFIKDAGKEKIQPIFKKVNAQIISQVRVAAENRLNEICSISEKEEREEALNVLCKELEAQFVSDECADCDIKAALIEAESEKVRKYILDKKIRIDGRGQKEIRPITCEVGVLPRTHGSSLFTRGATQSLAVTTLGTAADEQMIEALEGETTKAFMLHYSFPPFSVGEIKPVRGPGRREIGHGALAEKALKAIMPTKEEFPYTVRVVSEILESNGSSSMATVCASTLALMDAGVPIKAPVAGVALGLVKDGNQTVILTDISGLEDHFGDMDFKVAGTKDGVTAVQLDLKIKGISLKLLEDALYQAKEARLLILEKMKQTLSLPRTELSSYAPRIVTIKINPEKIGGLIGPGGKTIRKIIQDTGVQIDIEDDGSVLISSNDAKAQEKAVAIVRGLTEEAEIGKIYEGKITRVTNFGAFCEILPNKEGLIHVSELADRFVKNVEDVVKVGDIVRVKVTEIDDAGKIRLSKKRVDSETQDNK
ncbi:MAG: polyribonucleotide nucleotidyltransferase [Candidatus Omnitrophota bacterium]